MNIDDLEKKAAEGDIEAQYDLGCTYAQIFPEKEAILWWEKAADKGHSAAQYQLGMAYLSGVGVRKNNKMAQYWLEKAADQQHGRAKEHLILSKILNTKKGDKQ